MSKSHRLLAGAGVVALFAALFVGVAPAAAQGTATLSLFKRIENLNSGSGFGDRGAWDVQAVNVATGETFRGQGLNGIQSIPVPDGEYVISEIETDATPDGYQFIDWDCGDLGTFTEPTPTITLAEGANITCTVRNDAIVSTLSLAKIVGGGGAAASAWTLTAQGPTTIQGQGNAEGQAPIGDYTLSESGGPSGYEAGDWVCIDDAAGGAALPVAGGILAIGLGQDIACTITNTSTLPQLTLTKLVDGPPGLPLADPTEWTLSAAGMTSISGVSGSTAVTHAGVEPGGYTLSETDGPAGYTAGAWSCADAAQVDVPVSPGGEVTIAADADLTCTITNTFTGGALTLQKVVTGGRQPAQSWTLSAAGPVTISGPTGSPDVTAVDVPSGTYDLTEVGPVVGYETDGWVCTGATGATGSSVTIGAGDIATCVIENRSLSPRLTLRKDIVNRGGGPLTDQDWTLQAASPNTTISGTSGSDAVTFAPVISGTFTLSESSAAAQAAGYAASAWTCVDDATGQDWPVEGGNSVTIIQVDLSITCTVVNEWTGSTLLLNKQVLNPIGAGAAPGDFTLTAGGPGGTLTFPGDATPADAVPVEPGTAWTLTEDGPDGYTSLGWTCSPGGAVEEGGQVTIEPGEDVLCRALNEGQSPSLTLRKQLVPGAGSTAALTDFVLQARGPGNAAFSGITGAPGVTSVLAPPGEYVFQERGPSGFDAEWTCVGTTWDAATETATLAYGDDALCTVTNTPIPPTLALEKVVQGGGPATAADWTLTATGPDTVSGAAPVAAETVDSGTYTLAETGTTPATADYLFNNWTCTAVGQQPIVVSPDGPQTFTLPLGDDVTCAAINVYTPPVLTLVKLVDDGPDGPGSTPANWIVTAEGTGDAAGTTVTGPGGSADIVAQPVTSGVYELGETTNPAAPPLSTDYGATDWSCTGTGFEAADLVGTALTLAAGDDITCTIENVFDPPRLTLQKQVDGGPLTASDWTLTWTDENDPARTGSGTTGDADVTRAPVGTGTFRLSEASTAADAAAYTASPWFCTGAGLIAGDILTLDEENVLVTCTIANTYTSPPPPPTPDGDTATDPEVGGDGALPTTGVDPWPTVILAAVLLSAGIVVRTAGTRRRGRRS